jgi:hypothetical protein
MSALIENQKASISDQSEASPVPMPPTEENFKKVAANMQEVQKDITPKNAAGGKTGDEGQKEMAKKLFVQPFEEAGYDLDATLRDYATRIRNGDLTQDQGTIVMGVVAIYSQELPDLTRWGFIREDTEKSLTSALKQ